MASVRSVSSVSGELDGAVHLRKERQDKAGMEHNEGETREGKQGGKKGTLGREVHTDSEETELQ